MYMRTHTLRSCVAPTLPSSMLPTGRTGEPFPRTQHPTSKKIRDPPDEDRAFPAILGPQVPTRQHRHALLDQQRVRLRRQRGVGRLHDGLGGQQHVFVRILSNLALFCMQKRAGEQHVPNRPGGARLFVKRIQASRIGSRLLGAVAQAILATALAKLAGSSSHFTASAAAYTPRQPSIPALRLAHQRLPPALQQFPPNASQQFPPNSSLPFELQPLRLHSRCATPRYIAGTHLALCPLQPSLPSYRSRQRPPR